MFAEKLAAIALAAISLVGWNHAGVGVEVTQPNQGNQVADQQEAALKREGTITGIHRDGENVSVHLNGFRNGIVLHVNEDTKIVGSDGSEMTVAELTLGMEIEASHAPTMTMSLPPQTGAKQIVVKKHLSSKEVLGTAGNLESITPQPDGTMRIVVQGEKLTEVSPSTVSLVVTPETVIVSTDDNRKLTAIDLKPGMRVYGFYGPTLTRSIPPVGVAEKIVVE